ncbi:MAG: fibronectin type III domain-containing protein [Pseudomonadota bacterium]
MKTLKILAFGIFAVLTACQSKGFEFNAGFKSGSTATPEPAATVALRSGGGGSGSLSGQAPDAPVLTLVGMGSNYADLSWTASPYAESYTLLRKVGTGSYGTLTSAVTATTYHDGSLQQDTAYCYEVKAINSVGESHVSNEVCGTAPHCSNTAGPTIAINAANPTRQYPSINRAAPPVDFARSKTVSINYSLSDNDSCDSSFAVTVSLTKPDGSTVQVFNGTKAPGSQTVWYTIDTVDAANSPVGNYNLQISATDSKFPTNASQANYFQVLPLPANGALPTVSASANQSVCPKQSYTVTFQFGDDSTDSSSPALGKDWIRAYIYENGTSKKNGYTDSNERMTYSTSQSANVTATYTYAASGWDYDRNQDASNASTTVTVNADTQAPTNLQFTQLPPVPPALLPVGSGVTIRAGALDNCPNLQYEFSYILDTNPPSSPTPAPVVFRALQSSNSATFTPTAAMAGKYVTFHVRAVDAGGNEAILVSSNSYLIDNVGVTVTTKRLATGLEPSYYNIGEQIQVDLTLSGNNSGATINSLTANSQTLLTNVSFAGHEHTLYTTPALGGSVTLTAMVTYAAGLSVTGSHPIQVGSTPTVTVSVSPSAPYTAGQPVDVICKATDNNDLTTAKIRLQYQQDAAGFNDILAAGTPFIPDANGQESVSFKLPPFSGNYTFKCDITDIESLTGGNSTAISVGAAATQDAHVWLDYDLDGAMSFNRAVRFDLDSNETLEWTKWLNAGDGYLAIDRSGNSSIENIGEFAKLAELQATAGSVLDENDGSYFSSTVRIWVDSANATSQATTDSGELMTLPDAGIVSVTLNPCCTFLRK